MSELDAVRKINEVIVGVGGQASIAFSGISQSYRHLHVLFQGRSDAAVADQYLAAQFNGDTGTNYDYLYWSAYTGGSGTDAAYAQPSIKLGKIPGSSAPANSTCSVDINIPNYAGTTFLKNIVAGGGDNWGTGALSVAAPFGNWRSTAAITSILLFPSSGNFVQGSTASLYGIL